MQPRTNIIYTPALDCIREWIEREGGSPDAIMSTLFSASAEKTMSSPTRLDRERLDQLLCEPNKTCGLLCLDARHSEE